MAICNECGSEFTSRRLSDKECFKCKSDKKFKSDMSYYMNRVNYIKETYNFTTEEALKLLNLQILEDGLSDIEGSVSSIYDAVRDIN